MIRMGKMHKCVFCHKHFFDGQSTVVFLVKRGAVVYIKQVRNVAMLLGPNRAKDSISNVGKCLEVQSSRHLGDSYLIYWFPDPSQTNFTGSGGR